MRVLAALVALAASATLAAAGSADAPELVDAEGDCAVPYGNAYLDVASAWVDGEDEDSFLAHVRLAAWQEELGSGAGVALTFEHQGVRWGVVAANEGPVEGWGFWSGLATETFVEALEDAPGSFDAEAATVTVEFPKARFPHDDPSDRDLTAFHALTADIRPAFPFLALDQDANGKWVVCDVADGAGTYAFTTGGHSAHHAGANATAAPAAAPTEAAVPGPAPAEAPENATPTPGAALAAAAACAAAWWRPRGR